MIPEELSILGFYSYQTEQKILFSKLTKEKMFGIFGNVGSGKSSILEAITFALYQQTERLSQTNSRNYNLMNLKSNKLKIDFVFKANNKRYRFQVNGNRNKSDRSKVSFTYSKFIEKENEWVPTELSAEKILGLSYENFKRTIIIPQGKFQEFLNLKPAERTTMMKELFLLQKFDLSEQASKQESLVLAQLKPIEGQLLELGNPSVEGLEIVEKTIKECEREILILEARQEELQKKIHEQEIFQNSLRKIQETEEKLKGLLLKQKEISSLERELKEYEVYQTVFLQKYLTYRSTEKEIQELSETIPTLKQNLENLKSKEKKIQAEFEKRQKRMQEKDKYSQKKQEWIALKDFLSIEKEIQTLLTHQEKRFQTKLEYEIKLQKLKTTKEEKEKILYKLRERQKEHTELLNRKMSLTELVRNLEEYKKLESEKQSKLQSIEKIKEEFQKNLNHLFQERKEESLELLQEKLNFELEETEKLLENSQNLISLKEISKTLKLGDACPLCGERIQSTVHLERNLQIDSEVLSLKTKFKTLQEKQKEFQILIKEFQTNLQNQETQIQKLETQLENLKPYLPNQTELSEFQEIESKLKLYSEVQAELLKEEAETQELDKQIKQEEEKWKETQEEYSRIQTKVSVEQGKLEKIREQISNEVFEKGKTFSLNKINERLKIQEIVLERIGVDFEKALNHKTQLEKEISSCQNSLLEKMGKKEKELLNLQTLKQELETLFSQHPSFHFQKLEDLAKKEVQPQEIRKRIENFYLEKNSFETTLKTEKEKIANLIDQTQELPNLKSELLEIKQRSNAKLQQKGKLQGELNNLKHALQRKQELEEQKNKLQDKLERVNTLKELFKGQGFVNYISRIFLEDLCESANEKFFTFTRNRLRLELDENGEIQIRDYMHDGNLRHVKTLSGGQMFQASLAMALALSDRIQKSLGVTENFFFLDEGFGSLDKESLEVVFETLKSLKRENRIVGLISHVEEMKAEIRNSIWVKNDPEHGSIVELKLNY